MDNKNEKLPVVDDNGNVIGSISRGEAHSGSKILHPVVHLHVFNSQGEIYLQKRPEWKDVQPGKWDTATGGHIDYGEDVQTALQREVNEELGITNYVPKFLCAYVFESTCEKEFVNVFMTTYDGNINPNVNELASGKFWTPEEVLSNIGKGVFTPNFEQEYINVILPVLKH